MTRAIASFGTAPLTAEAFEKARFGDLASYQLMLRCYDGCERLGTCSLQLMAARHGRRTQLRTIMRRLRCSGCRRPPASIAITDGGLIDKLPTWRVVLAR